MRRSTIGFVALAALLLIVPLVGAQSLTGTIAGRVVDEQGGVLPGVTVTLTGRTGATTQVTDERGEFRFVGLNPGTYSVKAELQGFRPKAEENLDLGIGKTIDLKMGLAVGGLTETVEVSANAITVDTTTTATDNTVSQELLFSMPLARDNAATQLLNYSPGVNDGSGFGGQEDYANALLLDGVDTRDPEGGSAWTFFNYNIVEEVQVGGLGAAAEYGGFTGAVVNSITKSGGNRFSALNELRFTNKSLSSNNVKASIAETNPILGQPAVINRMTDYTVQLGGPIKQDKVFFFGSVQRYSIRDNPSGPRDLHTEVSPRYNAKFTFQPTPSDNIAASFQFDNYNQTGRTGFPGAESTQQQTVDQDSPEAIWNAQYRKVFGSSTFLEAKFTGYWGYYDLNPIDPSPVHYDGETGAYSGGAGTYYYADRTRNQVNASLTKYADFHGTHSFKFGAEFERSTVRNRAGYLGTYFYDYGGEPYLAYGYNYDYKGKVNRQSFYAQDQWKLGRVTANLGLRLDRITGGDANTGESLYKTFSVGPRVGAAVDVFGDGKSVLRGYFGRMFQGAGVGPFERALSGNSDWVTFEVGPDWQELTEVGRDTKKYTVDSDLKQVGVDEWNLAWEQMIRNKFKFSITGIYRNNTNFINSVIPGSRWTPMVRTNSLSGGNYTAYKYANRPDDVINLLIRNQKGFQYLDENGQLITTADPKATYKGLMFVLQKAASKRWNGQVSYVLSKAEGNIRNTGFGNISDSAYETPNIPVLNRIGPLNTDRTHEVKAFVGYQVPVVEAGVNVYYRYVTGRPFTAYERLSGSRLNYVSSQNVFLEPRGGRRNEGESSIDLRAEKVFRVGVHRFGVYFDVRNLFNTGPITTSQDRYPTASIAGNTVDFASATALLEARQATFGLRWSF